MTKPTDDPVLEALEDAISFLADIGAVIPGSYYKARAIQKAQMRIIDDIRAEAEGPDGLSVQLAESLTALDKLKEGK